MGERISFPEIESFSTFGLSPILPESSMDRMKALALGLTEVLRILKNNEVKAEEFQTGSATDGAEPPFGAYTVDVLLGLGVEISAVIASEIEFMSERAFRRSPSTEHSSSSTEGE
ncbi:hypothetical protein [Paraburkholderia ferrariae]|uniref:hypothetical protein n=1 Tax=Paraburkholderia ferrariae TaxID=386056 RepID=UPI0012EC7D0E|nr:hypothetical protein [Paraburkholderia ferrariae]